RRTANAAKSKQNNTFLAFAPFCAILYPSTTDKPAITIIRIRFKVLFTGLLLPYVEHSQISSTQHFRAAVCRRSNLYRRTGPKSPQLENERGRLLTGLFVLYLLNFLYFLCLVILSSSCTPHRPSRRPSCHPSFGANGCRGVRPADAVRATTALSACFR